MLAVGSVSAYDLGHVRVRAESGTDPRQHLGAGAT
jgi:hypothetical protein